MLLSIFLIAQLFRSYLPVPDYFIAGKFVDIVRQ